MPGYCVTKDIAGFEYDWLATDAAGRVGIFSTAGAGFAPSKFVEDIDAHDAAIRVIMALPVSSEVCFAPEVADNLVNTWRDAAMRGLFAFDSDPNGGPYRLVAAPLLPIDVVDLPEAVSSVAASIQFKNILFEKIEEVDREDYDGCAA